MRIEPIEMNALRPTLSDQSSERNVLYATIVTGVLACLMLLFEVLGKLDVTDQLLDAFSWGEIVTEGMVVALIGWTGRLALREMKTGRTTSRGALEARAQVESLFKMADMLQSAIGYGDANSVLRATAARLLPGLGGSLYIFNNSGDRLELSTRWNWAEGQAPAETISPSQCWALKRGKSHLNLLGPDALRCQHHVGDAVVLEIPMMARGEVYGLLDIQAEGDDAEARLASSAAVAHALADAMSLALSNIALREKLRTQALRDPLTGLYNRRYMEDVLDRYANLAERNGSTLAIVMFDLDHFKRLNDEHGHALGDAVLSEVAASVIGAIRPSDVACRYGGEEFVVLFPDCSMTEALAKAEVLRSRIERLSENHGARVSASFGVATIPETSAKVADVLADADAALYRAKGEGRNRVVGAANRPVRGVARTSPAAAA
jgi:diguanylate cyclase (GGDEF)-like protein